MQHNVPCGVSILLLLTLLGCGGAAISDKEIREILIDLLEMELEDYEKKSEVAHGSKAKDVGSWLKNVNEQLRVWQNKQALAEWNFATNITDHNRHQISEIEGKFSAWYPGIQEQARAWRLDNQGLDPDTDRQLRLLSKYAKSSDPHKVRQVKDLESRMSGIYSTARACANRETCMQIEPGLQDVMAKNRKPDVLEWAWKAWRDVTGPPIKPLYLQFVNLLNQGAQEHDYKDYGEFWRDEQFDQTPDLEEMADDLWSKVEPLYVQLHAYVRRKLREFYNESVVGSDGAIPAHLLGNMWAQNWQMIADIVFPPAGSHDNDISDMAEGNLKKDYNVNGVFRLAEEFYKSIGLYPMTDTFWEKSMLLKPSDRNVTCHASATDLYATDDFRIKMCSEVNMDYLYTIHHEMGHVQYFMAYASQPTVYRAGANSAFHEAVGDTMALSVVTRNHLNTIGLIDQTSSSKEDDIADLLNMALAKVAFLPYGYLIDKWRWRVFSGEIKPEELNKEYWKLRLEYQGIVPPVPRSEADFDPGAKYHVPAHSPYMIYFVSFLAQFQFYKSLCNTTGYTGELHKCDFYRSTQAGSKLRDMLELGASLPWPEALEKLTGSREVSVEPLLEYFKPLHDWLVEQNKGETLGWKGANIKWSE